MKVGELEQLLVLLNREEWTVGVGASGALVGRIDHDGRGRAPHVS
jgi:hypothetical protein